jgi:hypothetical protein
MKEYAHVFNNSLFLNVSKNTMKSIALKSIILFTVLAMLSTQFTSCKKKDETCVLLVRVVRLDGTPLSGANVKVTSNYATINGTLPSYLPAVKLTDASGMAEFTFKLPAILDIEVTSIFGTGQDLVKLVPGETVSKTVVVTQ